MPKVKKQKVDPADKSLVYYGPHECRVCDKILGEKKSRIVKAGNGAPDDLEFDYPDEADKVKTDGSWPYPNTHPKLKWKKHKHLTIK